MHPSGTAVVISNKLISLHKRAAKLMRYDSSLTTDTKLRYLVLLRVKEKLAVNKAVLVYSKHAVILIYYTHRFFFFLFLFCSNSRTPSRFIALPKPRIHLFKTRFSFSGITLSNSIQTQITRSKHIKGSNERYLLGQNKSKPANYRGNLLCQATKLK